MKLLDKKEDKLIAPIQQRREVYKPFSYEKYYKFYKQAVSTVWRPESVDMESDVKDFLIRSSQTEKDVIGGILKGFTILETHIGDYWSGRVVKMFPLFEIIAGAIANSFFEKIHEQGYSYLNDSLGITDYAAFLTDEVTRKKIEFFVEHESDLVSLAIFSGIGEGVSLYSSFSILLSLSRDSRYKGLAQIISWSILDEMAHSEMGCMLFQDLMNETGITLEELDLIYEGFDTGIQNEYDFIDHIFQGRSLDNITPEELKDYILIRANDRLQALGLTPKYTVEGKGYIVKEWFENEVKGQSSNDFFWQSLNGDNYTALLSQDFNNVDYASLSLNWKD